MSYFKEIKIVDEGGDVANVTNNALNTIIDSGTIASLTNGTQKTQISDGTNEVDVAFNPHINKYELLVNSAGHVCVENTTVVLLGIGGVFTGSAWQDTIDYGSISIGVSSDQNSAVDGLVIQWSMNASTVHDTDVFTIFANKDKTFTFGPARRYVRIKYTNGSVAQGVFNLETSLRRVYVKPSSHRITDSIVGEDDAELVKAVLTGLAPSGAFVNVKVTNAGNQKVSIEELESAVSVNSNTQLRTTLYDASGDTLDFGARSQTPTGNVMQVQIGPGDIISNLPVVIEYDHHQIHEGEAWKWNFFGAVNATTKDVRISVPTLTATTRTPHAIFEIVADNTTSSIMTYEGTTWTSGGTDDSARIYNRNRNVIATPNTKIYVAGATALTVNTLGTQIDQGYLFTSKAAINTERAMVEWVLKSNTEYLLRVTTTGNGSVLIKIHFYEDLGV